MTASTTTTAGKAAGRGSMIVLLTAGLLLLASVAAADSVRVRASVSVQGDAVRLKDIAELRGQAVEALGERVIVEMAGGRQQDLSLDVVRRFLDQQGVNMAVTSLGGFSQCRVQRATAAECSTTSQSACERRGGSPDGVSGAALTMLEAAPVLANPRAAVTTRSALTLEGHVRAFLAQRADVDVTTLTISFSDADQRRLQVAALDGETRVEIEPATQATLGRLPLTVRRWQDLKLIDEVRVTADVSRTMLVAVVTRSIRPGEPVGSGDLAMREMPITEDSARPVREIRTAYGQVAARMLRPGQVLDATDLTSPLLVKRGELVTVRCVSGDLVIRAVGRATEDGAEGQVINVRNEKSNQTFTGTVAGPREVLVSVKGAGL